MTEREEGLGKYWLIDGDDPAYERGIITLPSVLGGDEFEVRAKSRVGIFVLDSDGRCIASLANQQRVMFTRVVEEPAGQPSKWRRFFHKLGLCSLHQKEQAYWRMTPLD